MELKTQHSRHITLSQGASSTEMDEFERALGRPIASIDSVWKEALEFSDGMRLLRYSFYRISDGTINTIVFKTRFLWEVNPHWQGRMFLFMGGEALLEFGILDAYLEKPCVSLIRGYQDQEAIPISSSLDLFFSRFLLEAGSVLEKDQTIHAVPSLAKWPPSLKAWYSQDIRLRQELQAVGPEKIRHMSGRYAGLILNELQQCEEGPSGASPSL